MKTKFLQVTAGMMVLLSSVAPDKPRYLYVWAGDADKKSSDFLAVLDVTPQHPTYGRVLASVAAGAVGTVPHHTEYALSPSGFLFANGFESGKSFIFDVRDPLHPRLARAFDDVQGYMHPHSFVRLPNGHVLASFHMRQGERGGGLVEMDNDGHVMRTASAVDSSVPDVLIRPYSIAVLPKQLRDAYGDVLTTHGTLLRKAFESAGGPGSRRLARGCSRH